MYHLPCDLFQTRVALISRHLYFNILLLLSGFAITPNFEVEAQEDLSKRWFWWSLEKGVVWLKLR